MHRNCPFWGPKLKNISGEGAQPPPQTPSPWWGGTPPHPLAAFGRPASTTSPSTNDFWIRHWTDGLERPTHADRQSRRIIAYGRLAYCVLWMRLFHSDSSTRSAKQRQYRALVVVSAVPIGLGTKIKKVLALDQHRPKWHLDLSSRLTQWTHVSNQWPTTTHGATTLALWPLFTLWDFECVVPVKSSYVV